MNAPQHDAQAPQTSRTLTRRATMRGLGGMSLAALLATQWKPATAQDATPPAQTGAVGIAITLLGAGPPGVAPALELTLRRTVLAPGGRLPDHTHPGALVIYVEAGTFGYTALGGIAQLTRATAANATTPAESMPVGTEVLLTAGDWIFVEDPRDDIRNAGADDVVLLVAGLTQIGAPFTTFMEGMDMDAPPASSGSCDDSDRTAGNDPGPRCEL